MSGQYYGNVYDFSDRLFLKQRMPDVPVYDATGKHAKRMIGELHALLMRKDISNDEYNRITRHIERYKRIMYRHEYWIPEDKKYYFDDDKIMQLVTLYGDNIPWHEEIAKGVKKY